MQRKNLSMVTLYSMAIGVLMIQSAVHGKASVVERPDLKVKNAHYISNRTPLKPSSLIKLPIGSIQPEGWLEKQLRLQADGFHGHLGEISQFLKKENNSWLSPTGQGSHGWEEVPYWLKGYLNCAYVLNDQDMIKEAGIWIEGALKSQKEDGWFGPDLDRSCVNKQLKGREDLWPNAIMLFCLQDYYDVTGDKRVIELMSSYFKYLQSVPEDKYLLGYWPKMRGGDILYSIYWLYNRTGDAWLLELAEKNHRKTARWDQNVIDWHNVNIAQAFGEGATWWLQSGQQADLRSAYDNWQKVRDFFGQVPGGMFGGDENSRLGHDDPRQAVETCGMVEEMLSDETLIAITGDLVWADRCEDVAYNSFPAALTADMKAIRYLMAPNHVLSDITEHNPGIQNGGPMFHMNPHRHRCCQHNYGHGWPYFAQHLWYATPDNGLAAIFYNASTVTAKIGKSGQEVTIKQETHYPFDETIKLSVAMGKSVKFPLYLRIPSWCEKPLLKINGKTKRISGKAGWYIQIDRTWKSGDDIKLTLPMEVSLRTWTKNHNSISVDRGPLTYSLQIGEKYIRSGGTDKWPAWEIYPETPWNYGLVLNDKKPSSSFKVVRSDWPANNMPWAQEYTPILLKAKGARIPQWSLDEYKLCGLLQTSPVKSDQPIEEINLVPMGAARLRVSAFPVVSKDPDANQWHQP